MKKMNEENMTPEQKEMFMKGVYAILHYNYEQYERCGTPDAYGVVCGVFDCLGQSITLDLLRRVVNPGFINSLPDLEEPFLPPGS